MMEAVLRSSLMLLGVFATTLAHGAEPAPEERWDWFSDAPREIRALLADPRETQIRVGVLADGHRMFLDMGVGGHLGVLRRQLDVGSFSVMVRGLVTGRFQFGSRSFDHQNSDFIGGMAASYRRGPDALELFLSHQSSHLGDDVRLATPSENHSFESVRLLYSRDLGETVRVYAGTEAKVRADPRRLSGMVTQIGGGDWRFGESWLLAVDLRLKQENDFSPNVTSVLAYELGDPRRTARRQRLFLEAFNGYSNLGQFSTRRETYVFLGFGFTL